MSHWLTSEGLQPAPWADDSVWYLQCHLVNWQRFYKALFPLKGKLRDIFVTHIYNNFSVSSWKVGVLKNFFSMPHFRSFHGSGVSSDVVSFASLSHPLTLKTLKKRPFTPLVLIPLRVFIKFVFDNMQSYVIFSNPYYCIWKKAVRASIFSERLR